MQTKGNIFKTALAGSVAFAALASNGAAWAADTAEASDPNMIVVTANKRTQNLIDVPQAITAVSGEALQYRNQTRIEEFAQSVPGLSLQQGSVRQVKLIIRGVNSGGASANVGVVVDETPFSYQSGLANGGYDTANLETYDMAGIEVLKGPQGTLYGAGAEAGLLKYKTNAPNLNKFEAAAETGGEIVAQGNVGTSTKGMINIPFWGGKAALRAVGFYTAVPGWIDNPLLGRENVNRGRKWGGRISLMVKPVETLSIRLTASRQDQSFDDTLNNEFVGSNTDPFHPPANAMTIPNNGRLVNNSQFGNPSKNYYEYGNATIDWDTGFANLVSSTSYGKLSTVFRADISFSSAAPGVTYKQAFGGVYGANYGLWGRQTNSVERYNQEFRLTSKPDSNLLGLKLDWQLGAFYAREDVVFSQFYDAVSTINQSTITTPFPVGGSNLPGKYEEYSGFGSATLHLTDRFDVTGGIRYASISQASQVFNYYGLITGLTPAFQPFLANPKITSKEHKVTWNAAANYKFTDDSQLYARIATGYRSGGPNLLIPGAPADFPTTYKADNLTSYEVGLRTSLLDKKLTIDVAAFYLDWKDIQILTTFVSQPSGVRYSVTGNAGQAKSQGFEWNLSLRPVKGITISDNGAYTDAHLTSAAASLGAAAVVGAKLAFVPDWSNTLNVDFDGQLSETVKAFGGVSWVYTGTRFTDFGNSPSFPSHYMLPSYNLFNVQAGVEFGAYSVSLYVRNLADKRAITSFNYASGYNLTGTGTVIQPRTVGIRLGAKF